MRRWSELAERVAATTRTSEKTALLAITSPTCRPTSYRSRRCSWTGGPFPRPTQRAPVWAGRRSAPDVTDLCRPCLVRAGEAYDRSSDLGMAVADVLSGAARARSRDLAVAHRGRGSHTPPSRPLPRPAAKSAIMRDLLARADPLTAKYIVKVLAASSGSGCGEGLVEAAIAKAFDLPLDEVKWAGC
jgi:hypothetical protein